MKKANCPTPFLVKKYIKKFDKENRLAEQAIGKLLQKFPENKKIEEVLWKVSIIDGLYRTNLDRIDASGVLKMARRIFKLHIDQKLKAGDLRMVDKISRGHNIKRGRKGIRCYSFATKYCNWHNQTAYPIYDTNAENAIIDYTKKIRDGFPKLNFPKTDLKNIKRLKEVILCFQNYCGLNKFSLKEMDKFLYTHGKEISDARQKQQKV